MTDIRGFAYVSLAGKEEVFTAEECKRIAWKISIEGVGFKSRSASTAVWTLIPWGRIIYVQTP